MEDADRFLIFGTQKNLDILTEYSNWFADGTFKIVPHLFYQLHTLHALHEHSVLPMLYIFMQSKREQDYTRVLTAVRELKENLRPTSIMIDFEIGFHNALREVFQINDDVIMGCLFHLGQCVYRKVQGLGLSGIYLHNEDIRLKCKMLVALAFIHAEYVIKAFETLSDDIEDALIPLFDYFEDTWIGRPGGYGI